MQGKIPPNRTNKIVQMHGRRPPQCQVNKFPDNTVARGCTNARQKGKSTLYQSKKQTMPVNPKNNVNVKCSPNRKPEAEQTAAKANMSRSRLVVFGDEASSKPAGLKATNKNPLRKWLLGPWERDYRGALEPNLQKDQRKKKGKKKTTSSFPFFYVSARRDDHIADAAYDGDLPAVRGHLRRDRGSLDRLDRHGWAALHWAAQLGHRAVVAFLVAKGAAVDVLTGSTRGELSNRRSRHRRTPLRRC